MPPANEKVYWKRYVYLWLYYSVFEETVANTIPRANAIYEKLLSIIPHEVFTFS